MLDPDIERLTPFPRGAPLNTRLPQWKWLIALICTVLWGVLGPHYLEIGRNATSRPESTDFHKFYLSAERYRQGLSMYWMVPPRDRQGDPCHADTPQEVAARAMPPPGPMVLGGKLPCLGPNLNPPVFMVAMLPLSRLPYPQAWWAWAALTMLCAVWGIWVLVGQARESSLGEQLFWTWVGSTALFAWYPTLASFSMGQLGMVLLPLLALCRADLRAAKAWRAGFWLGLGIAIKPFMLAMLIFLLIIGRWRAVVSAVLAAAALSLLGLALFGIQPLQDYLLISGNVTWTSSNWNGSWFGFFDRMFSGQADATWPATRPLSRALGISFALATLCATALITRKAWRRADASGVDAAMALGLTTTLIVAPLGWVYYFPALTVSLFGAWPVAGKHPRSRHIKQALLMLMAMSAIPIGLKPIPTAQLPSAWWALDAWYTYCLIGLGLTLALTFTPKERGAEAPLSD
jgi:hypothetical protein